MTTNALMKPNYRIVADQIIAQILDGVHRPGQILPPELELAEQFGVTRSTVREGIRLLEETGMLRRKSVRRLVVAIPEQAQVAERTVQALLMRKVTVKSVYDANLSLEPVFAHLAAESATETQIARLQVNLAETQKAADEDLGALDAEFHHLVAEATNNAVLILMRQPMQDLFMPTVKDLIKVGDTQARMVDAHGAIVEAITNRDAAKASDWMQRHVADFKRGMLSAGLDMNRVIDPPKRTES